MSFIQQIQPIQVTYSSFRELGQLYLPGNRPFALSYHICWHSCPIPIMPSVCTVQQRRHPAFILDVGSIFCISLLFVPSFRSLPFSPNLLSSISPSLPLPVYHLQRPFVLNYCCCCVCDVVCVCVYLCVCRHMHTIAQGSFQGPVLSSYCRQLRSNSDCQAYNHLAISPFLMTFFWKSLLLSNFYACSESTFIIPSAPETP